MQNSQEQENSFNFVNELELSNTKKEKTSEQFYGFDDFNNSMDGVMKS